MPGQQLKVWSKSSLRSISTSPFYAVFNFVCLLFPLFLFSFLSMYQFHTRHPKLLLLVDTIVLSVDLNYVEVGSEDVLRDGAEVAIIPPISGG